jgi:hypothetical protein
MLDCLTLGGFKPSPSGDSFSTSCGRLEAWSIGMAHTAYLKYICT